MPRVIDLFAGCGGMTEGFRFTDVEFEPVAAVEFDLAAAATYAANFGESHTLWRDISTFGDVPKADVVIGGPPCQGFSNLGTKDPDDPRNSLWREYMRVVLQADPAVFVLENVQRFSRSVEFEMLIRELSHGRLRRWRWYSTGVLNAADFGVPQRRIRTIIIASRIGPIDLPIPTHAREGAGGFTPWRSVRSAIAQTHPKPAETQLPARTTEVFGKVVPGAFKMHELHIGRRPTEISLERYGHIPPGGGRHDLPKYLLPRCWAEKLTGTTDVMGRMRWDEPSLTIRTEFFKPEKGQYLHPQWDPRDAKKRVNRPITHLEAALLQGFPEDFVWCGTKVQIARQIGNAVPPALASAVADVVLHHLS